MFGLPTDFDGRIFVGRTLMQVCFGPYSVHLDFDESLGVVLESAYILRVDKDDTGVVEDIPLESSRLMVVTGKVVVAASGAPDGTLELRFENGAVLILLDTNEHYESYQIYIGEEVIVV